VAGDQPVDLADVELGELTAHAEAHGRHYTSTIAGFKPYSSLQAAPRLANMQL
jgi:hypothetical protein